MIILEKYYKSQPRYGKMISKRELYCLFLLQNRAWTNCDRSRVDRCWLPFFSICPYCICKYPYFKKSDLDGGVLTILCRAGEDCAIWDPMESSLEVIYKIPISYRYRYLSITLQMQDTASPTSMLLSDTLSSIRKIYSVTSMVYAKVPCSSQATLWR